MDTADEVRDISGRQPDERRDLSDRPARHDDGRWSAVERRRCYGVLDSKDALQALAAETGGARSSGRTTSTARWRSVSRDSSAYYLLAYESPHPDDGKFHNVRVKVKRPRVNVNARSGYWAFKRRSERDASRRRPAPCPAEVTAAFKRLAESLRPDADEPAEPRRLYMPSRRSPAARATLQHFLAAPTFAVAQGRWPDHPPRGREFPRAARWSPARRLEGSPPVVGPACSTAGRPTADGFARRRRFGQLATCGWLSRQPGAGRLRGRVDGHAWAAARFGNTSLSVSADSRNIRYGQLLPDIDRRRGPPGVLVIARSRPGPAAAAVARPAVAGSSRQDSNRPPTRSSRRSSARASTSSAWT